MRFAGVLEPLLVSVERGAPSGAGRLAGQHVLTSRKDVTALISADAEGNIHFLLSPSPDSDLRFARIRLKALTIARREWAVGGKPTMTYLDLTCSSGTHAGYRRPFLSFCEDLLTDLDRPSVAPDDAAFRTCTRWQHFWSSDEQGPVSPEWVRGLLGELRFLETLIRSIGTRVIGSWTGPDARDHDFQAMSRVAFEVKVSATVPYTIECNLNQLDPALFDDLYVVCFQAVRVDAGETIVDVVSRIENALEDDETHLDAFYLRLHAAGYRRQLRPDYEGFHFTIDGPNYYRVDRSFPNITAATFDPPLDARIRYMLQLVGIPTVDPASEELRHAISRLV